LKNRAWLLLVPVLVVVAFSAIIPLMTVVNYAFQDILAGLPPVFVGWENFHLLLTDPEFRGAIWRQLLFSAAVLVTEIPLGILIALALPARGLGASLALVLLGIPLLIPWNVVGTIWRLFTRTDIGFGGALLTWLGVDFNVFSNPIDAWATVLVMDIWHWTPLVALLCYAGLRAIPEVYYRAAEIDGASAWQTFRHVQLPKLRGVLTIALLLRFMDSFMIYTEPFVLTGGGPGNTTTFLSQDLARRAVGQFDLGIAAAYSLIYFLLILAFSFVFYQAMTSVGRPRGK
jgi:glycerol transport system permease protein